MDFDGRVGSAVLRRGFKVRAGLATYPTYNSTAPSASVHQISCTLAHFPADEMACFTQDVPSLPARLQGCERCILSFVFAVKGLLDETTAVLEEIVTDLATSEGERV